MTLVGKLAFLIFLHIAIHLPKRFCKSLSNSATFLPFATVLIITPKPLGAILLTSLLSLSFSFGSSIFCDIEILVENGTKTKNLPAIDNSDVTLGPFVEIGSFTICISID